MAVYLKDHRNLLLPYIVRSGNTNGIDWIVNDDGSVTLNGIASDNIFIHYCDWREDVIPKGIYFLSGGLNYIDFYKDGYGHCDWWYGSVLNLHYSHYDKASVFINIGKGSEYNNTVLHPQIGYLGAVNAYIKSDKNLFDISKVNGLRSVSGNWNSYLVKTENTILIKRSAYSANSYLVGNEVYLEPGKYTFSTDITLPADATYNANGFYLTLFDGTNYLNMYPTLGPIRKGETKRFSKVLNVPTAGTYYFSMSPDGGKDIYTNMQSYYSNIQFEKGETATDYTPYGYQKITI